MRVTTSWLELPGCVRMQVCSGGRWSSPHFRIWTQEEQQELLERIRSSTDEEEKYPLLFTFDFQEDMEVFLNMAAEEDLRVNAMFLGRWVDSQ
ncbi:unnamed protein product [Arctogadus glacialis]